MSDPVSPEREEIVYAVCDIEAFIGPKLRHDVAGQYNRFDVLALRLNRTPCRPIIEVGNSTSPEDSPSEDEPES